ncbi:MAG: hypothetical protein F6J93_01790 [Oscillatoria sp. SIO1A7]|nr:hypothetical protein [Oscillatoria sp. SIO1A7]
MDCKSEMLPTLPLHPTATPYRYSLIFCPMPDFLKVKKTPTKRSGAPRGAYLSFVFANTKRGSLSCLPNETR